MLQPMQLPKRDLHCCKVIGSQTTLLEVEAGKTRYKEYRDDAEEIVQGIHEPIISEDLFYEVQNVLNCKKKAKTKYSLINDEYPMRGNLLCPRCGRHLTGSSALGNGGKYYYYHFTKGCKERYKNTVASSHSE